MKNENIFRIDFSEGARKMDDSKTKIEDVYVDRSLGFDVTIRNAPMRKVYDEWVFSLNKKAFQHAVLISMALGKGVFTGPQIRFIRKWVKESTTTFGERFGVSHPSVLNWEKGVIIPKASTLVHMRMIILKSLPEELVASLFDSISESFQILDSSSSKTNVAPLDLDFSAELATENRFRELRVS